MNLKFTTIVPVLAITCASLLGCGGDDSKSATTPQPVPKTDVPRQPQPEPSTPLPDRAPDPRENTPPDAEAKPTTVTPAPAAPSDTASSSTPDLAPTQQAIAPPQAAAASNDKVATFDGFTAPKPATWIWQPTQRMSAIAEYGIPGRDGLDQGRLTVFRVGGSPEMNIARWREQQFRGPNQTQVQAKTEPHTTVEGWEVTLVELKGEYKAPGAVNFSPNHTLLAAIYPHAPGGQIILYMVGPDGTIEPNRQAFMDMMLNLRQVEPTK